MIMHLELKQVSSNNKLMTMPHSNDIRPPLPVKNTILLLWKKGIVP